MEAPRVYTPPYGCQGKRVSKGGTAGSFLCLVLFVTGCGSQGTAKPLPETWPMTALRGFALLTPEAPLAPAATPLEALTARLALAELDAAAGKVRDPVHRRGEGGRGFGHGAEADHSRGIADRNQRAGQEQQPAHGRAPLGGKRAADA